VHKQEAICSLIKQSAVQGILQSKEDKEHHIGDDKSHVDDASDDIINYQHHIMLHS